MDNVVNYDSHLLLKSTFMEVPASPSATTMPSYVILEVLFSLVKTAVWFLGAWGTNVSRSRFGHSVRRPTQFVCPNRDSVCPNRDKIYLTIVTFLFLLLFFAYWWEARLISPFRFVDCPLLASRRDAESKTTPRGMRKNVSREFTTLIDETMRVR